MTGVTTRRALVVKAQAGDRDALLELIELCAPQITNGVLAAAGTFSRHDREDAESEAFLAVWKSFESYRGESDPCGWMYSVARRTAAKRVVEPQVRQRKVTQRLESFTRPASAPGSDHRLADLDLVAFILSALDPDHAEVLRLHVLEGKSYQEIAADLHVSEGTVGSRLNRAKRAALQLIRASQAQDA